MCGSCESWSISYLSNAARPLTAAGLRQQIVSIASSSTKISAEKRPTAALSASTSAANFG